MSSATQTHLCELLTAKKPDLFGDQEAPVLAWRDCWAMFFHQIPQMFKNNESWFYYHRATKQTCCGTDALIAQEFASLESQGLTLCDDSKMNQMGIYVMVPHPKKKKMALRCDLSFRRYLGDERDDGSCAGAGLCPLLWGVGGLGDGLTYMNVKITEVPLPKDQVQAAYDVLNNKWAK